MDIQRKMRAIKRDVVFKCDPQLPAQRSSYWLQSRPEQTVMHDQKIDILFCSLGQTRVETSTAAPMRVTRPEFSIWRPLSALSQSPTSRIRKKRSVKLTISPSE